MSEKSTPNINNINNHSNNNSPYSIKKNIKESILDGPNPFLQNDLNYTSVSDPSSPRKLETKTDISSSYFNYRRDSVNSLNSQGTLINPLPLCNGSSTSIIGVDNILENSSINSSPKYDPNAYNEFHNISTSRRVSEVSRQLQNIMLSDSNQTTPKNNKFSDKDIVSQNSKEETVENKTQSFLDFNLDEEEISKQGKKVLIKPKAKCNITSNDSNNNSAKDDINLNLNKSKNNIIYEEIIASAAEQNKQIKSQFIEDLVYFSSGLTDSDLNLTLNTSDSSAKNIFGFGTSFPSGLAKFDAEYTYRDEVIDTKLQLLAYNARQTLRNRPLSTEVNNTISSSSHELSNALLQEDSILKDSHFNDLPAVLPNSVFHPLSLHIPDHDILTGKIVPSLMDSPSRKSGAIRREHRVNINKGRTRRSITDTYIGGSISESKKAFITEISKLAHEKSSDFDANKDADDFRGQAWVKSDQKQEQIASNKPISNEIVNNGNQLYTRESYRSNISVLPTNPITLRSPNEKVIADSPQIGAARAVKSSQPQKCLWSETDKQTDICGEVFVDAEGLYTHLITTHVGRRTTGNLCLECKILNCSQRRIPFMKRDHVTSHLRSHVPLKSHACQVCLKSFKWPHDLKKHILKSGHDSVINQSLSSFSNDLADKRKSTGDLLDRQAIQRMHRNSFDIASLGRTQLDINSLGYVTGLQTDGNNYSNSSFVDDRRRSFCQSDIEQDYFSNSPNGPFNLSKTSVSLPGSRRTSTFDINAEPIEIDTPPFVKPNLEHVDSGFNIDISNNSKSFELQHQLGLLSSTTQTADSPFKSPVVYISNYGFNGIDMIDRVSNSSSISDNQFIASQTNVPNYYPFDFTKEEYNELLVRDGAIIEPNNPKYVGNSSIAHTYNGELFPDSYHQGHSSYGQHSHTSSRNSIDTSSITTINANPDTNIIGLHNYSEGESPMSPSYDNSLKRSSFSKKSIDSLEEVEGIALAASGMDRFGSQRSAVRRERRLSYISQHGNKEYQRPQSKQQLIQSLQQFNTILNNNSGGVYQRQRRDSLTKRTLRNTHSKPNSKPSAIVTGAQPVNNNSFNSGNNVPVSSSSTGGLSPKMLSTHSSKEIININDDNNSYQSDVSPFQQSNGVNSQVFDHLTSILDNDLLRVLQSRSEQVEANSDVPSETFQNQLYHIQSHAFQQQAQQSLGDISSFLELDKDERDPAYLNNWILGLMDRNNSDDMTNNQTDSEQGRTGV